MNIIFILTSIFFFIWVIRNSLFWVYLWQIKEYRLDRMYVHLKETLAGRSIIFSYFSIIKWIVVFAYVLVSVNNDYLSVYRIIIFIIFGWEAASVLREILSHNLQKPVVRLKTLFIIFPTLFFVSLLYALPFTEQFLWLLFLDRLVFLSVSFFVLIMWLPTDFYFDLKAEKAIKKIEDRKDLLVIGITGSYGKSTTKEFVSQILSKKYTVLKTKGTNNTLIGVVNTILSGLRKDTEIFVVEMGAYKKGEIAGICDIVNPKIGIITGISNQHLSLFGSQENILQAKYELIEHLPKNGLALFNASSIESHNLYKKIKKKKILYQVIKKPSDLKLTDIFAYDVSLKKNSVSFKVNLKNKVLKFHSPLIGKQNVENILPGIYLANYLGLKHKEIENAIGSLVPLPKAMTRHKVKNGLTLIDDSFNASAMSVMSALDYLKLYKGDKIMVLSPMIELGKDSKRQHFEAGLKIGKTCDFLFLTNKNFQEDIINGIKESKGRIIVSAGNLREITDFIKQRFNRADGLDDIILFEGKQAGIILNRVL